METVVKKATKKNQRVKSFVADPVLDKRIRMEAVRLDREESYVMRLYLRKAFGLKVSGTL